MVAGASPQLIGKDGQSIRLGSKLGQGGEGIVFAVASRVDVVAKVYLQALSPYGADKLTAMIQLSNARIAQISAWPSEVICQGPSGPVVGFLMPRIANHDPIHVVYSPKDRKKAFPDATWAFLVHTAANVARAVSVMHQHGVVIGDINHGNVVVSHLGMVKFIDCDSMQISANGQRYLCEVGVETHTPPELQDRSFKGIVRTTNHDTFGLAVIIFQLLFLGRHPFSGIYHGSGDMPIDRAIKEFRFAYGPEAAKRLMSPPPATLPLEAVSRPIASLFSRAFSPDAVANNGRPTAVEWATSLTTLSQSLRRCSRHAGHYYYSSLTACPWCQIESQSGTILFNIVAGTITPSGQFNLESVWSAIAAVPSPGEPPPLTLQSPTASTVTVFLQWAKTRRRRNDLGVVIGIAATITGTVLSGDLGSWLVVVGVSIVVLLALTGYASLVWGKRKAYRGTQARLKPMEDRWRAEAGSVAFDAKRRELEAKKKRYGELPAYRQQKLQELTANQRAGQLRNFLDSHRIRYAQIKGIGPSRIATLQSFGIETAYDVRTTKVMAVPGFGPVLTANLVTWRDEIERRFVFDPRKQADPRDVATIDQEIEVIGRQLQQDLRNGPTTLQQLARQALLVREAIRPSLEAALQEAALAKAELDAINVVRLQP